MENSSQASVLKEFDEESKNRIYTGPAKRLLEKLDPMKSHVETYQKRWFWELVQNACDYNDNVRVELEITPEYIYFRHNGDPFKMDQAQNLIFPNSDKDEKKDREIIGQYGSGFISTHILSSQIAVEGVLLSKQNEKYAFRFSLDRSDREEKSVLAESLQNSEREFKNSLKKIDSPNGVYTTQFSYKLNAHYYFVDPNETIERGRAFIEEVLPYVFAFQHKLVEVCITEGKSKSIYNCSSRTETEVVTSVIDYEHNQPQGTVSMAIKIAKHEETYVAAEVEDGKIKAFPKNFPRLFKAYPLIGTEEFPFPCIVHSLDLVPTLERNSIELSENDTGNRRVLEKAIKAYGLLLEQLIKEGHSSFFNLCELMPGSFDTKIQGWFKLNVSDKLKERLLTAPVVLTNKGTRVNLREVKFPVLENELYQNFYRLLNKTTFIIPAEDEASQWAKTINFAVFTDVKFNFKNLLTAVLVPRKEIHEFLEQDTDTFEWLKEFIDLIIRSDEKILLYDKAIVPQQDNKLRPLKNELFWDNEISEELKDILELISENSFRKILMHKKLEEIGEKLLDPQKEKSEKDILDAIDKALQKAALKEQSVNFLDALRRILKWTNRFDDAEIKSKMPWFAVERASLVMKTLASDENRDMAFKIIQSGKMDILAELAESDLTADEINSMIVISNSGVAMSKIAEFTELSKEVGADEILALGKEKAEEKRELLFKKEIGENVEQILNRVFEQEFPNYEARLDRTRDYDILIRNKQSPAKQYFIELKSVKENNAESIKMGIHQARKAKDNPENYALLMIRRPQSGIVTEEYLKNTIICDFQIGKDVTNEVEKANTVDQIIRSLNSIKLEIKDPSMKVSIRQEYIERLGKDFEELKAKIHEAIK